MLHEFSVLILHGLHRWGYVVAMLASIRDEHTLFSVQGYLAHKKLLPHP
jgi:hypothetical protein